MPSCQTSQDRTRILVAAGLPIDAVTKWNSAVPEGTTDFSSDRQKYSDFWFKSAALTERLPDARRCNESEQAAAAAIRETARQARTEFLRGHVETIYDILTDRRARPVRVQHLVVAAADVVPGLVPSAQAISADDGRLQRDRSGIEIDQGLFASAVLGNKRTGVHLCHAMLLARAEAVDLAEQFRRDGVVELAGASVRRNGRAAIVTYDHPRFLNAEDQGTLDAMEICVVLALLDDLSEIVVLRGGVVEHPNYRGRRIFGAGINLTHLPWPHPVHLVPATRPRLCEQDLPGARQG